MNDETIQRLRSLSQGFHRAVVHATHNVVLYSVYENLYELLDISRQFTISTSGISYSSILAHEALFNNVVIPLSKPTWSKPRRGLAFGSVDSQKHGD